MYAVSVRTCNSIIDIMSCHCCSRSSGVSDWDKGACMGSPCDVDGVSSVGDLSCEVDPEFWN